MSICRFLQDGDRRHVGFAKCGMFGVGRVNMVKMRHHAKPLLRYGDFSERERTRSLYAIVRPSIVCLSSVTLVRTAPYSSD